MLSWSLRLVVFILSFFICNGIFSSSVLAAKTDMSLRGDKNFSANNLPTEVKAADTSFKTYISSVRSSSIKAYPHPYNSALSGDLYSVGRVAGPYMANLLFALRVTGDLYYLDEVANVMNKIESKLDWSGGDPGLHWLQDANSSYYNTKYNHEMDNELTLAALVDATYAFHVNANNGSNYGQMATKWLDIIKRWEKHLDGNKKLFHPYTEYAKYNYLMYKITGESKYRDEYNRRVPIMRQTMKEGRTSSGTGTAWDHFTVDAAEHPYGCQLNRYATLTSQAMMTLHFEGASMFDDRSLMEKIMRTIKDDTFKGKYQNTYDLCGGNSSYGLTETSSSTEKDTLVEHRSQLNYVYFDNTGTLASIINGNKRPLSFYYQGWVMMSAAKGNNVNVPTSPLPTPEPTPTPTPKPTPLPSPTPSPTPSLSPSPSPSLNPSPTLNLSPSPTAKATALPDTDLINCRRSNIDGKDRVDLNDYTILARNFFKENFDPLADIYEDGRVDLRDYATMTRYFLQRCDEL